MAEIHESDVLKDETKSAFFKKKNILVASVAAAVLIFGSVSMLQLLQPSTNIIVNPGFEEPSYPLNWSFVARNGVVPVWDNTVSHSGSLSVKISVPGVTNVISGEVWSDNISTHPGETYTISAWGKTQGAAGTNNPAVRVAEYSSDNVWLRQTSIYFPKGTNDWNQRQATFNVGEGAAYLRIYANIWNGYGTAWFDDIVLIQNTDNSTPVPTPEPTVVPTVVPTTPAPTATPIGNAYYVSTSGNDNNPGTISSPWRTIQKAANTLNGGQTAYVRGGTYNEKVTITRSGSSGNYITISAYPGEKAIINANGKVGSWDGAIHINSANWIKIVGFEIYNSGWNGIMISDHKGGTPTNIYIQNNIVHAIQRSGLYAEDARNITYDGNTVYDTQKAGSSGGQQNENVNLVRTNYFEIKNNRVYGAANYESIDVKEGSSYGSIHHNDISGAHSAGIYIDSQGYNSQNIDIYSNKVHDSQESNARGIAIGVENSGSAKNMRVYNNLVWNMGATGIVPATSYSEGAIDNIAVVNNVAYNNGLVNSWGGGIIVEYGSATNMVVRNNIAYGNRGRGNLITTGNTYSDKNLAGTDPRFINPGFGDFHLQIGSPAINTGSRNQFVPSFDYDGKLRPQGTGYDIGAYER